LNEIVPVQSTQLRAPWDIRLIHMAAGVLVIGLLIFNGDATNALGSPSKMGIEATGALVLAAVTALRIFWVRFRGHRSALSGEAPIWERVASKVIQQATYWLTGLIILTGFALAIFAPLDSQIPWLIAFSSDQPQLFDFFINIHSFMGNALIFVIAIHFTGALWHLVKRRLFRLRNNVWSSMMSIKR
jgi:cytochrome b561